MMKNDPIIAELRAAREAHAAKFDFDIDKIGADIRARQEQSRLAGRAFVTLPSRQVQAWEKSLVNAKPGLGGT
jgi:hypothetical protein